MNIFVYGTLLVPQIWELVTGAPCPEAVTADLSGYAIHRVANATFPGIVASDSGNSVTGRVVLNVSSKALARLDAYEDSFYERISVTLSIPNLETVTADTYVVPVDLAGEILSEDRWTLQWFEENHEESYLARMRDAY